ncbi:hypothetical protein AMATHDRAFT_52417 [Amanita thiersii Skay4041]|uniref:Uncharacterized protein n=1 Tax=Amanita thiersii Skay4041 TaxID=703135 RepID=A0A2A9NUM4_9AGAR|nr:hypothetical protein AMATHDRAFT_52417 [Amanita thiersii Skay4041]
MKLAFYTNVLFMFSLLSAVSAQSVFVRQLDNQRRRNDGGRNNNNGGNGGNNNGGNGGNNNGGAGGDPQTSLTLDPAVIAQGFANDGQDVPTAGQVPSLTSTNNFINFCLTVPNLQITNGKQIQEGSCNPAPIGVIPSVGNMPSSKFVNPKNGGTIAANQDFQIQMAINNLETGNFVNAQENYFAAPQQVNAQGNIIGHSHVVVELLNSLDQTTPTDPTKFAFFKGLNDPAQNGVLTADVTDGLPAGAYRLCSINAAANHQPAIVPVAQHGSLDDCVYFTATEGGVNGNDGNNTGNTGGNTGINGGNAGNTGDNTGTNTGDNTGTNTGDNTGTNTGDNNGTNTGGNNGGRRGGRRGRRGQQNVNDKLVFF